MAKTEELMESDKKWISVYADLPSLVKAEEVNESRRAYKVAVKDRTLYCVASSQSSAKNAVGKFLAAAAMKDSSAEAVGIKDLYAAIRDEGSNGQP